MLLLLTNIVPIISNNLYKSVPILSTNVPIISNNDKLVTNNHSGKKIIIINKNNNSKYVWAYQHNCVYYYYRYVKAFV